MRNWLGCLIWVLLALSTTPFAVSAALLGLAHDTDSGKQQLVEIDPATGTTSLIGGGIDACCAVTGAVSAADPDTERLYFVGRTFAAVQQQLYTLTLADGSVLQNPVLSSDNVIQFLEYDRIADTLFGIAMDTANRTAQLVSVNPGTGALSTVGAPLADCCEVAAGISALSYQGGGRELHFLARLDAQTEWRLFTAATATGAIQQSDPLDADLRFGGLEYNSVSATLRVFYHDLADSTQRIGSLDPVTGAITPAANGQASCCILLPGVTLEDSPNGLFYAAARRFSEAAFSIQAYATADGSLKSEAPLSDTLALNALLIGGGGGNTGVSIATSQNPSAIGQTVTFTITVSGNAPTGSVSLFDGGVLLANAVLSNPGNLASVQAVFDLSDLSGGVHPISARYSGDSNNPASSSRTVRQTVNRADTLTGLAALPAAPVAGQPLTLTASVTVQPPASGTATGSVCFLDNTTVIGSAVLDGSGQVSMELTLPAAGDHNFTAEFLGNSNFNPSTSTTLPLTVAKAGTNITLSAAPDVAGRGQTISLSAQIFVSTPGGGVPEGTVTFANGADILGSTTLNSAGSATLNVNTLAEGGHTLTAEYSGNTNYLGSLSTGVPVTVSVRVTSITMSANPTATRVGSPIMLTALVDAASLGVGTPAGMVTFLNGADVLGIEPVDASGMTVLSVSSLAQGSHALTARYDGSASFDQSTAEAVTVNILLESTTSEISASETIVTTGQAFDLTAMVTPGSGGGPVPSGTVNFMLGSNILGSNVLDGSGSATLTTNLAGEGMYRIVAAYQGDAAHAASDSMPLLLVATSADKQFTGTTAGGADQITLAFTGGGESCAFTEARTLGIFGDLGSPDIYPRGYRLDHGLFTFIADGCSVGGRLSFVAIFPDVLPDNSVLLKFAPTSAAQVNHWFPLPAVVEGNRLLFEITDGGQGDADLIADGRIVDPAGPAIPLSEAVGIPAVGIPAVGPLGLTLLALLIVLAAIMVLHGQGAARRRFHD